MSLVKDYIAGGVSSALSRTILAPIKTVHQHLYKERFFGKNFYKGFVYVFKKQGIYGLWRHNLYKVIRYHPHQALNFAFKDFYKKTFWGDVDQKKNFSRYFVGNFTSGVAAGATSFFLYDLWVNLAWLKYEGIVEIHRRLGASLPRHVIYSAVYFGCYDTARGSLPDPKNSPLIVNLVIAQVVTICSILLTHPFYTVDSRMLQSARKNGITYNNTLDCWSKIYKNESVSAFYKGGLSKAVRTSTGGALTLVFYDEVKKQIFEEKIQRDEI